MLIDSAPGGLTLAGPYNIDVAGGFGVGGQASAGQFAFGQIATPKPPTLVLFTLGMAWLVGVRAWRRRHAA